MKTCVNLVFPKDAYISVDFLEKKCEVVKNERCSRVPGDFDMILQNAEGVKKNLLLESRCRTKQCHSG
jgi:hypothetical protein